MNTAAGAILLFFSGVIAFVPERPGANLVNAYLIKVTAHDQRLRVPLKRLKDEKCPTSSNHGEYCKKDKTEIFCDCAIFENITVSIPDQEASDKKLPDKPPGELPKKDPDENTGNFDDIDWLVNMWAISPSAAKFKKRDVPGNVGGQLSFNWTDAATCLFEEARCMEDGKKKRRIYAVNFDVALMDNPKQAVPELVVFKSENKLEYVTIKLARRENQQQTPIATLEVFCPNADPCPVMITNTMYLEDNSDELCDPKQCGESKKEGEHFREYHRISSDPFGISPHRLCKTYISLPIVSPRLCKLGSLPRDFVPKTVSNRIICPSTILTP